LQHFIDTDNAHFAQTNSSRSQAPPTLHPRMMSGLPLVRLWIALSVLASAAGWILSALGGLNGTGYAVTGALGLAAAWWLRPVWLADTRRPSFRRLRRRFTHPLPLAFAGLAVLVFLGGALYAPANYDGLTYRVPRVLHWLAAGHWHWIHTVNYRMNDRNCGFEWLMTPLLAATHSDRALFLINFLPFLLLPGLTFSVFTRLGVRPRVAWYWMWLLPTGYSFLLQAASLANDAFASVYALAALDFALRAAASRRLADVHFSLLSAALLTGAKSGNLPLLLPWAIAFLPLTRQLLPWAHAPAATSDTQHRSSGNALEVEDWKLNVLSGRSLAKADECSQGSGILRVNDPEPTRSSRPPLSSFAKSAATLLVILAALLVSFLPTALLNRHYCGDWSGLSLEPPKIAAHHPLIGVAGNSVKFLLANFCPTIFPMAGWWNHAVPDRLPARWAEMIQQNFEANYCRLGELPTEEWSGLGFGLSCLLAIGLAASLWCRPSPKPPRLPWTSQAIQITPYLSLLSFFAKSGMMALPRLVAAYYPLLLPALLSGLGPARIIRQKWWRYAIAAVLLLAGVALVLTPPRPLWPAKTVLAHLGAADTNPIARRIRDVYFTYAERPDPLAAARAALPDDCRGVGFVAASDDPQLSFWRPYGTRRVEEILDTDPASRIRDLGLRYVIVTEVYLQAHHETIGEWLAAHSPAVLVTTITVTTEVSVGPAAWYVVRAEP
jgi:hypothetical protein